MKARHQFDSSLDWLEYLRFYYAGQAIQGLLASFTVKSSIGAWSTELEETAEVSVKIADALIKSLNENKEG